MKKCLHILIKICLIKSTRKYHVDKTLKETNESKGINYKIIFFNVFNVFLFIYNISAIRLIN